MHYRALGDTELVQTLDALSKLNEVQIAADELEKIDSIWNAPQHLFEAGLIVTSLGTSDEAIEILENVGLIYTSETLQRVLTVGKIVDELKKILYTSAFFNLGFHSYINFEAHYNPNGTVPTPPPGPRPDPNTDSLIFVRNVSLPDGTVVSPNESFSKTWRLRNTGTTTWDSSYQLTFVGGEQMGAPAAVNTPNAAPGQEVEISVNLTAPSEPGTHRGYWQMRNPQGTYFGQRIWVEVVVPGSGDPSPGSFSLTCYECPSVVPPGYTFRPEVYAYIGSGQLLATRGDMLRNTDGNLFGAFPHIAVVGSAQTGQEYEFRFYADNPITAPTTPGVYESKWRLWQNGQYVGPELTIRFEVRESGTVNHAPNPPRLKSPIDWAVTNGTPTLEVDPGFDPDGDSIVAYYFDIYGSHDIPKSGWIGSQRWTPPGLGYYGYQWRVKARDSRGAESDWSETWHFSIYDPRLTITQFEFVSLDAQDEQVRIRACTNSSSATMRVDANTAANGTDQGEWKTIKELGVPCFNDNDAPVWHTLDFESGPHLVRVLARVGSDWGEAAVSQKVYTIRADHRPSGPKLTIPAYDSYLNSRSVLLEWESALRVNDYVIQVSPNATFSPLLLEVTLPDYEYQHEFTLDDDYETIFARVIARNQYGTNEATTMFHIDRTPPDSNVLALPTSVAQNDFAVSWDGSDDQSGVNWYHIQVREGNRPDSVWTDWLVNTTETTETFQGQPGHRYYFRARVMDKVGNWEAWPAGEGDTNTVIDPVTDPGEGSAELRILSINTYPPEDDQILVEVIVENAGDGDTGNGFFTDIHVDHIPVGANDFTGSVRFWVNDPIPAYSTVSLTAVLDASSAAMMGATTDSPAAGPAETSSTLYAQVDSTGVVAEADNTNNITDEGVSLCFAAPDASESANWPPETLVFELGQPLVLNLHTVGDEDWLAVDLEQGVEYRFTTSDLGPSADTILHLYDEDATTLIASNDDTEGSLASQIVWQATATATYYLRVTHWNPTAGGCGTTYTISYDHTAQNPSDIEFVSQIGGVTRSVAVQGTYAYIGEGSKLTILNVGNPGQPTVVGRSPALPGVIFDIAIAGDWAYVADGFGGLQLVDITPASAPVQVGAFATQGEATSVVVAGDYAYLADYSAGLHIVDISNPHAPAEVGFFASVSNPIDVAIAGNTVYLADEGYGLRIIDVSDPADPFEIGHYQTPGYPQGIAVNGQYAYMSAGGDGVYVFDVSNPASPTKRSLFTGFTYPQSVAVVGNLAYIATGFNGLQFLDVTNPGAPTAIAAQNTPGYASSVVAFGNYAYVADRWAGLRIVNAAAPESPFEAGFYDMSSHTRNVIVAGEYAYVASEKDGLRVVDVTDPASPQEVGALDTPGDALGLAVVGGYVYVADYYGGLRIIDVSTPTNPTEIGAIDTPGAASEVAVVGTYAYVADGFDGGLRIIDVADPTQPREVGFYNTPGWAFGVAVANNLAFVADEEKLIVVDVTNPTQPTLVSSYDIGFARGVAIVGDLVYVASASSLLILDASVPSNLTEVGAYNSVGWAADVSVEGSYAYLADAWVGLHVVRIDNPSDPVKAGEYPTPWQAADSVFVAGDHIYVADNEGGLVILRFTLLPTITGFTPLTGEAGTVVTINGTKLTGATAVAFNDTPVMDFTVVSAMQITAVVPAGATTGPIRVTTPAGTAESDDDFIIIGEPPTISSFSPTSGPVGTSVTINGAAFSGATAVTFNGTSTTSFTVNSATQITAIAPTGAITGKIAITTPDGTATSAADFTIIPPPTVSGFTPTSGPTGTSVTITGAAFSGATAVTFNGTTAASFTVNSATQITAIVPTGAMTGKITVTTPGGTATSAADFTVTTAPPFPDVFYLSPSANVTIGGIAAQGADVLRYTRSTNSWTMVFDGSNHGLTKNVSAFTFLDDGSLLFVLAANQTIAGLGAVTPYDVIKFTPNALGVFPLGTGTYSWYAQLKPKGLTTAGEKIDAIDVVDNRLLLSTGGAASVPKPGGGVLKPADEDVFVYNLGTGAFEITLLIDGSKMPGMAVEDITGIWDDPQSGDYYITIVGAFNLGGVKGNDKSIVKLTPNGGASVYTPSLVSWLAAGATLPTGFKIDSLEMAR